MLNRARTKTVFVSKDGTEYGNLSSAVQDDIKSLIFADGVSSPTRHDTMLRVLKNAPGLISLLTEYMGTQNDT